VGRWLTDSRILKYEATRKGWSDFDCWQLSKSSWVSIRRKNTRAHGTLFFSYYWLSDQVQTRSQRLPFWMDTNCL
jgi:hypothetical protein